MNSNFDTQYEQKYITYTLKILNFDLHSLIMLYIRPYIISKPVKIYHYKAYKILPLFATAAASILGVGSGLQSIQVSFFTL